MKDISKDEFEKAPPLIQNIYMRVISKVPIGHSVYEKAIDQHPEYFPDEVQWRKKWAEIPQEVHDAYEKEMTGVWNDWFSSPEKKGKGILYWINHPEEWEKIQEKSEKKDRKDDDIWNKHYSKYMGKR